MKLNRYSVIILAAGYSSRMGSFKPVIMLDQVTVTDRLIATYRSQDIDVYLVVGWQKDKLLSTIHRSDIKIVENPAFSAGMLSSVKAGLSAVKDKGYRGVFIQPVDIPLVRSATLKHLVTFSQSQASQILYPCFKSRRGHPTLIASELIPEILDWNGENGLKGYLFTREERSKELEVADSNILFDIDTPQDLIELVERYRSLNTPETD
jgi:molybdenum cofactor cytidylyltransferase